MPAIRLRSSAALVRPAPVERPLAPRWQGWRRLLGRCFAVLLLLVTCRMPVHADIPIPALTAYVTDTVGLLDAPTHKALEQELRAFEQRKGAQVAVLIVATTQPETIEQYGIRVAEAWKLGRSGVDDGAILLIARDDHRLRIEVGYGLEGALNDAVCKRIISEIVAPQFKRGDFAAGVRAGVERVLAVIDGEPLPPPPRRHDVRARSDSAGDGPLPLLFVIFVVAVAFAQGLRRVFGESFAALGVAASVGAAGFFLLHSLLFALFAAFVALLLAFLFFFGGPGGGGWGGGWGGGGWGDGYGGSYGGGSLGGGGLGGSVSGGGGSFGGGGASGDW